MRIESTECLCETCGKVTTHARKVSEVNHVMWALLGLLTCGLLWFVWLLQVMTQFKTNWACQECALKREQEQQAKPLQYLPLKIKSRGQFYGELVLGVLTALFILSCFLSQG